MASSASDNQTHPSNRGFASMDPDRQRAIASQGGKAAHQKGTAHQFTPEEARLAGSKGAKARHGARLVRQAEPAEAGEIA